MLILLSKTGKGGQMPHLFHQNIKINRKGGKKENNQLHRNAIIHISQ